MINLTPDALDKLKEIISEDDSELKLRLFVQGGGCSGFQYGFTLEEVAEEDDFNFEFDGISVLVDPVSLQYAQNVTINFQSGLQGDSFTVSNPDAVTTCGCGSSFSV